MTRREVFFLILIVIVFGVALFFRLDRADLVGDEGHYAFRSVGYVDYIASLQQTTPLQWFGYRPLWSFLSFHDHPPLVFLAQYLFLSLFGVSVFVLRTPSVLAGMSTLLAVFFIARLLWSVRAGYIATIALGVSPFFFWISRIGYLESILISFMLWSVFCFLKGLSRPRYFILAGVLLGLACLSKYTALFLVPVMFLVWCLYAIFQPREKRFFLYSGLGVLVFLVCVTPLIAYNAEMYKSRGHFDVQFSDVFHQQPQHDDWPLLTQRFSSNRVHLNISFIQESLIQEGKVLMGSLSIPYFFLFLLSFLIVLQAGVRRACTLEQCVPLISIICFSIFFIFVGPEARYMSILTPFIALTFAEGDAALKGVYKKIFFYSLIVVGVYAALYALNTHVSRVPIGTTPLWYSSFRDQNVGYRQLDRWVESVLSRTRPTALTKEVVRRGWYGDFKKDAIDFSFLRRDAAFPEKNIIIVYDIQTDWFNTVWILERWKFYHRFLIVNTEDFASQVRQPAARQAMERSIETVYFIKSADHLAEASHVFSQWSKPVQDLFSSRHIVPATLYDDAGRPAFYIYTAPIQKIF